MQKQKKVNTKSAAIPLARRALQKNKGPKTTGTPNGVRICHSEYSGSITNGNSNGVYPFPQNAAVPGWDLNPSSALLFPWLSQMSGLYERFTFESVTFRFVPSQASTIGGKIYVGFDYDYDDNPAVSIPVLLQNMSSCSANVWEDFSIQLDKKNLHPDMPYKYISVGTRLFEPRTSFCGYLQVWTNCATPCVWDLWVDYTVRLEVPQLDSPIASLVESTGTPTTAVLSTPLGASQPYGQFPVSPRVNTAVGQPVIVPMNPSFPSTYSPLGGQLSGVNYYVDTLGATLADIVRLGHKFIVTGQSPATVLATSQPAAQAWLYDTLGIYLGSIGASTASLSGANGLAGPVATALTNTFSAAVFAESLFSLKTLRTQYPSLRYIVPIVVAAANIGAGSFSSYSTW